MPASFFRVSAGSESIFPCSSPRSSLRLDTSARAESFFSTFAESSSILDLRSCKSCERGASWSISLRRLDISPVKAAISSTEALRPPTCFASSASFALTEASVATPIVFHIEAQPARLSAARIEIMTFFTEASIVRFRLLPSSSAVKRAALTMARGPGHYGP